MTMMFKFLLFTCACALGAAGDVPTYEESMHLIEEAIDILEDNVVSMDGNVPALDDSRRHYAAIVRVVSKEAVAECSGIEHDYYNDYQRNINESLTYADAHPQEVIDMTKKVINDVRTAIDKNEQEIVLAAGLAATQLILDDIDYFASISQNLSSHNFVITGAKKLRKIVMALKDLYRILYEPSCYPY